MTDQTHTDHQARRQTKPGRSRTVEPGRKAPHPADALPFTHLRTRAEVKTSGRPGRSWWHVQPTGDYGEDCRIGEKMGLAYLSYEANDQGGPGHLPMIVAEMPSELTGIEVGFLTMVSYAAAAGKWRAERVSAYWDRKFAELEAEDA